MTTIIIITLIAVVCLLAMENRGIRNDKDRIYVILARVRADYTTLMLERTKEREECAKVNDVCTQYRMALMQEEQQCSNRYTRSYEIIDGNQAQDGKFPLPNKFSSGRVAAFFFTDWSKPEAHLVYWENLGKLYSIERGATSRIIDGYTIKVY